MPAWAESLADAVMKLSEQFSKLKAATHTDAPLAPDSDRADQARVSRGRVVISSDEEVLFRNKPKSKPDDWDSSDDDSPIQILEMEKSKPSYYRKLLSFLPVDCAWAFRKPDEISLADGIRICDIPVECRPVRSHIKSKMLLHAYNSLFSTGMFVERFGAAASVALRQGQSPQHVAEFLVNDVVAPVARMCANTCHLISLYAGESPGERGEATFGLVLDAPSPAATVAPIAKQLGAIKRQAAEKGLKDAERRTVATMATQLRGERKQPPRLADVGGTTSTRYLKPRASASQSDNEVPSSRHAPRRQRKRATGAVGAGGVKERPAAPTSAAAAPNV